MKANTFKSNSRRKRRRTRIKSIEEKIVDKIREVYNLSPKEAWEVRRLNQLKSEMRYISTK